MKTEASCSALTLFFAMISDILFFSLGLGLCAISGNRDRVSHPADLSTSFSLFFVFYFLGYFDLVLDKPALTDVR